MVYSQTGSGRLGRQAHLANRAVKPCRGKHIVRQRDQGQVAMYLVLPDWTPDNQILHTQQTDITLDEEDCLALQ